MVSGIDSFRVSRNGEYYDCQIGFRGQLSVPFQLHLSDTERFPTAQAFEAYVIKRGMEMIEVFGDSRNQRLEMEVA